MKKLLALLMGLAIVTPASAAGNDEEPLRRRILDTYAAAANWLVSAQSDSGAWKLGPKGRAMDSPAMTSIMVTALASAPKEIRTRHAESIGKAVAFIASKANDDGSFGEGPRGTFLKTYTTALALMALSSADREKHANLIRGAQAYLKHNQLKEVHPGGLGYGDATPTRGPDGKPALKKAEVPNLSVTGFAAEGMKASGLPQDDEFWKLVVQFVQKCQNSTETNTDPAFIAALKAEGLSIGNDGGLFYAPIADRTKHRAGIRKIADREVINSYGAMTYDGIKTYLYAGLAKDDPRVRAAVDWVRKNYTLDAHPGFPYDRAKRSHLRGLYYYYLLMARAFHAYGENPFITFDGKKHDWAADLAERLVETVRESRMWQNDNPSWYEGDPVLVTGYVLMTLDILVDQVR